MAYHYKWTPAVIDGMYFDDAMEYAKQAQRLQNDHYCFLLDIAAGAQSGDGYKTLRRALTGKDKPKLVTPKTEAEVREMMKGRRDGF